MLISDSFCCDIYKQIATPICPCLIKMTVAEFILFLVFCINVYAGKDSVFSLFSIGLFVFFFLGRCSRLNRTSFKILEFHKPTTYWFWSEKAVRINKQVRFESKFDLVYHTLAKLLSATICHRSSGSHSHVV